MPDTTTDRELLELAAKAFWADEIDDVMSFRFDESEGCIAYIHADNQDHNGQDVELAWDPLTDDGDAFRLAAKLYLWEAVRLAHREVSDTVDIYAATRRAIVRAAAQIQRAREAG